MKKNGYDCNVDIDDDYNIINNNDEDDDLDKHDNIDHVVFS